MQEDHIYPQQRLMLPTVWLEKHEDFVRDLRATVDLNFDHIFDDWWNLNSLIISIFVFLSLCLHTVLENVRNVVARSDFYLTWHSRPFKILLSVLCVFEFQYAAFVEFYSNARPKFSIHNSVCELWTALRIDSQVNNAPIALRRSNLIQ